MVGRKPLTRERILESARALADAEGLDALTMRRLAAALDVEAMSLYHHVPNKDALLDGLVAAVIGEVQDATSEAAPTGGRRYAIAASPPATSWSVIRGRRGSSERARPSPQVIFYYEDVLGLLIEGGFSYALAHKTLHALGSMSLGFVQELFSPTATGGSFDVDAAEAQFEELVAALPHMMAMVAAEIHANDGDVLGSCDNRVEFEFTVNLLLDGLERQRSALGGSNFFLTN